MIEFVTGTGAVIVLGVAALAALGYFYLWRARRKLRQTT
jgi:LPXTG-motif cell wall-anchored protein